MTWTTPLRLASIAVLGSLFLFRAEARSGAVLRRTLRLLPGSYTLETASHSLSFFARVYPSPGGEPPR